MDFFYAAYGLSIRCDFALPEMATWDVGREPDVRVERAAPRAEVVAHSLRVRRASAHLEWPGVGRFEIEGGRRVRVEAAPDAPETTLRAYLLGPVFSVLLYQRGFLVLHASVVSLRGSSEAAIGFLGHSGDGKSTMAATLHARGHRVVSDDVAAVPVVLEGQTPLDSQFARYATVASAPHPPVFPAWAQLRLWPPALEALGEDASALPLLTPGEERRVRRVEAGFDLASVSLRALFVLDVGDEVAIRRFAPARAVIQLVQHTYCRGLRDPDEAAAQFHKCGVLAQTLPVWALQRPRDLTRLAEVAALVETHCASEWT